ncbi:hypothetical protein LRP30_13515 [Bradyrhizobium sp. C-145]|uniref:hypothetical protein n=1 Tax=Bradyrhizobium sp. C-145 TaxID=574727 RepID=UPI00201B6F96|nr:hypothetical protein [Bradyrhizobium sp. C-145]UQR68271.1 hypothetical protein LRP30_13515 [Bradyrhizobium sp. C-145]
MTYSLDAAPRLQPRARPCVFRRQSWIEGAHKLVLVDGVFAADLSDIKALASEVSLKTAAYSFRT